MRRYVLVIVAIFALMTLGIVLIGGGSSNKKTKQPAAAVQTRPALHEFSGSSSAKFVFTTQGAIVGDDQYRQIRITITRDSRRAEVLSGYDGRVERTQEQPNTQDAFDAFIRSLEQSGFEKTQKTTQTDERGACPAGSRFIYEANDGTNQLMRSWSSTCGAKTGTFGGSSASINRLFQAQITDYTKFISGIRLS